MNRHIRIPAALTIAAATVMALAAPSLAFAHARYERSTPGPSEVIAASPARVEIAFSESIQKAAGAYDIEVNRDRGASVTSGPAVVDDSDRTKMSVLLQPGLLPGRYVVNWRNTSDGDGDPANGAFSFYVNARPNTVDLANDAQLAQAGFEAVTRTAVAAAAEGTPGATSAPVATPQPATTRAAPTTSAAPTATPAGATSDDADRTTLYVIIAVVAVAVAIIAGAGVWQYRRTRP